MKKEWRKPGVKDLKVEVGVLALSPFETNHTDPPGETNHTG
jgi:hypothetical protein